VPSFVRKINFRRAVKAREKVALLQITGRSKKVLGFQLFPLSTLKRKELRNGLGTIIHFIAHKAACQLQV